MKKLNLLFAICLIVLISSCSQDDNSNDDSDTPPVNPSGQKRLKSINASLIDNRKEEIIYTYNT